MRQHLWLAIRVAFVAYWVVVGARDALPPFPLSLSDLLFALVVGCLGSRFYVFRAYTKAGRTEPWLLPSWFINPFQARQPFQFFHLAAVSFVALGLTSLLRTIAANAGLLPAVLPTELLAAAFGVGTLMGIRWAILTHRSQFVRASARDA
jgi:hypothetical protein